MMGLQSWLSRYEKQIAVAAMALCVIALFTLKLNRNLAPIPCVVFAMAVYRLKKRRSLALIAWLYHATCRLLRNGGTYCPGGKNPSFATQASS